MRALLAQRGIGLLVGVVGLVLGLVGLQACGMFVFAVVGFGSAPWQHLSGITTSTRLVMTVLTSFAVLILTSVLMMTLHLWYPAIAFVLVAGDCLPSTRACWWT